MKKYSIYAFMSAIALAGSVGISSCSSTGEEVNVNPEYNPDTNEVPVSFVFNISTGNTPTTRMSEANVQATKANPFRGMEETILMSYKLGADNKFVSSSTATTDKLYGLGPIIGASDVNPDPDQNKSNRILELAVPVGTNAMMFYGKAKKDENSDDTQGKIDMNLERSLDNIYFKLCRRIPEGTSTTEHNTTTFGNYQTLLLAIINTVIQSKFSGEFVFNSVSETIAEGNAIKWESYGTKITGEPATKALYEKDSDGTLEAGDDDPANPGLVICGLGEILSSAFYNFNKFYDNTTTGVVDLRAGSGYAVQKVLTDLYTVIASVVGATPTNREEAIAQQLALVIQGNLNKALAAGGGSFESISTILNATHMNMSTLGIPTAKNNDLAKFPEVFGVPDGTAVLQYDLATNTYSYRTTIPTYNMGGGTEFNLNDYMYPAELCYFGNSPIRKTDDDTKVFPNGVNNWDNDDSWAGWSGGHVESSTRKVAMKYNINYGTSLLKTRVKYSPDDNGKIYDNKKAIQDARNPGSNETNQAFDVSTSSPFSLVGILVGGQNPEVGWNYLAKTGSSFTAMIYDRDITATQSAIPTTTTGGTTAPIYTLLWDNWDPNKADGDQNTIYVALEFRNNSGIAFWGESNLIPDGGTFYISGKLDPDVTSAATLESLSTDATTYKTNKALGITWPTKYALPPYDADGNTIKKRRVFIQDFMTDATFVIGPTSLQKAMIAVPDLRSSQLSVGLSVDLQWSTGLKFDEVILGNN